MTARPSGAFCSPPSPRPVAMGTMPIIMARAVIRTGRIRTKPACTAASRAFLPSCICSRAKETIKMLFAVATPMHMIEPGLKIHDDEQVCQDDCADQADAESDERSAHCFDLAANDDVAAFGDFAIVSCDDFINLCCDG